MNEARERLIAALPYLRHAVKDAQSKGEPQLAVLSTLPDGSGKIVVRFDCTEFMKDLALVIGAGEPTREDELKAEALRFIQHHGLTVEPIA